MAIGRADRNRTRRRVVVIGAGFSGTMTAANMLRLGEAAPQVTLVERGRRFGPGEAYGDAPGLVHAPARAMSAFPDAREHFVHWLEQREGGDQRDCYAPRRVYGAYLEHILRDAAALRWPSLLTRVRAAAVACRRGQDAWCVSLANGRTLSADVVVLALGHPSPPAPAPFAPGELIDASDLKAQARMRRGDVLVLGAGRAMADVATALAQRRATGLIYALSPHGIMPQAHAREAAAAALPDLPGELSALVHLLRARARAGEDWRALMEQLRAATPALWARAPLETQRRFLRHLRPWWQTHRHRIAPQTAARLDALIAEGRVRLLAGEVASAVREGGVWRVQHRQRGSLVRHRLEVSGVINCAEADGVLTGVDDALVRQLLEEGYARAPANGLGLDIDAHDRLRDAKGVVQPGLFGLGQVAIGAFWETTTAPELRARASAIARQLA